jgi:hypothetical protein
MADVEHSHMFTTPMTRKRILMIRGQGGRAPWNFCDTRKVMLLKINYRVPKVSMGLLKCNTYSF